MLRALLLLALGLNVLLWAYGQNWLAPVGWPLVDHREPARLQQQVAPEGLRLRNGPGPAVAAPDAAVAPAPAEALSTTEQMPLSPPGAAR